MNKVTDGSESPVKLIFGMCVAEVLSMVPVFSFPALIPIFFQEWGIDNTAAGWINGVFFGGYTAAVAVLASLTDRVDPRRIYMLSAGLTSLAAMGFALLANGFWTALLFRTLGGIGLAGTYIPGLKALVDRLEGKRQARAISFYTATFGMGTALSFFATGVFAEFFGWRRAFALAGVLTLLPMILAGATLRPRPPQGDEKPDTHLLDFRPVLRNRRAMAYILAYASHMWELFATRSWMVAFLAFSLGLQSTGRSLWTPTTIAAISNLLAMWASITGAELALRFGRKKILALIMMGSALFGCLIGFTASLPYPVVALLCILYCLFVQGDSAALHTGTVQAAAIELRGATLAAQSLIGFFIASVSPLAAGLVLDHTGGGQTVLSWGVAFISIGFPVFLGPFILRLLDRPEWMGSDLSI